MALIYARLNNVSVSLQNTVASTGNSDMNSCGNSVSANPDAFATGNAPLLLHEIRHALQRLLEQGETTVIDLRSLPLAPGEEQRLGQTLGVGELSARLEALGPSTMQETAFAGVWLITHYNENDEIMGKFIEITFTPTLLGSQRQDVAAGLQRLTEQLAEKL